MSKFQWKAQVDVQQTIYDGGRIRASQEVARHEAEEKRLSDDVELYQLRNRIDDIYFGLLLLIQQQDAILSSLRMLEGNLKRVKSLVRNGAAMQSDADAIEAELLSAGQQLTSVKASMRAYRCALTIYIGEKANEELELPPMPAVTPTNDSGRRPEQQLLTARQMSLKARQEQVKTETMPHIRAFAQGYFGYPGMNFMEAMLNRNPSFNALLGVSVSWNIGALYTLSLIHI